MEASAASAAAAAQSSDDGDDPEHQNPPPYKFRRLLPSTRSSVAVDPPSKVEFLGQSESNALCVVYPPSTTTSRATNGVGSAGSRIIDTNASSDATASSILSKLELVERILRQKKTLVYLQKTVQLGHNHDCRMIQSERFEIFVQAAKYGSSVWYTVLTQSGHFNKRTSGAFTKELVAYATTMAKKDPRMLQNHNNDSNRKNCRFGNFSLIVSYSTVPGQEPHIDLLLPSFQFGLMISDASPTTKYFEVPAPHRITTGKQLAEHWSKLDDSIPSQLIDLLTQDLDVNNKLGFYGNVFSVVPEKNAFQKDAPYKCHGLDSVPRGTLLSLPGGEVHAGPATAKSFRGVLFFSGLAVDTKKPTRKKHDPLPTDDELTRKKELEQGQMYDPDSQYSSVILMSAILFILWRQYEVTQESRIYLLKQLRTYVEGAVQSGRFANVARWYRHFSIEKEFQAMLKAMELKIILDNRNRRQGELLTQSSWEAFYKEYAQVDYIVSLHVETDEYVGEFRLVSKPGLHVESEGKLHAASVFHRIVDDRIVIYYWDSTEWEGSQSNDHYRLRWHNKPCSTGTPEKNAEFDGMNGLLYDTDGELIKARVMVEDAPE